MSDKTQELCNAQKKLELNTFLFKIMRNPENYETLSEDDFVHDANGNLVYTNDAPDCEPLRKPDSFLKPIVASYHNASEFLFKLPNTIPAPRLMPEMDGTLSLTWDHISKKRNKSAAIIRFIGDNGCSGFIEFNASVYSFDHTLIEELVSDHPIFMKIKEFVDYHTVN